MDRSGSDDESVVGDIAHIIARDEDGSAGPRAVASLSPEERESYDTLISNRNKYVNLLLLCKNHHKQVDDQPTSFPVAKLLEIKVKHESWVRGSLTIFDAHKQRDDELYADYVDRWTRLMDLREWINWTDGLFSSGQPSLSKEMDMNLEQVRTWLLNRIWPHRYPKLESAFMNFRWVLEDFHRLFREYAEERGARLITEKFYKRADEPGRFDLRYRHYLEWKFDYHVYLVEDLGLELTRAANRVCDEVRANLDSTYMLEEGRLMIRQGPSVADLSWKSFVVEYEPGEEYRGVEDFKKERKNRGRSFGGDDKEPPAYYEPSPNQSD